MESLKRYIITTVILFIGTLCAVITVVKLYIKEPASNSVSEVIFTVNYGDSIAAEGAVVILDDGRRDTCVSDGTCSFFDVSKGRHEYTVLFQGRSEPRTMKVKNSDPFNQYVKLESRAVPPPEKTDNYTKQIEPDTVKQTVVTKPPIPSTTQSPTVQNKQTAKPFGSRFFKKAPTSDVSKKPLGSGFIHSEPSTPIYYTPTEQPPKRWPSSNVLPTDKGTTTYSFGQKALGKTWPVISRNTTKQYQLYTSPLTNPHFIFNVNAKISTTITGQCDILENVSFIINEDGIVVGDVILRKNATAIVNGIVTGNVLNYGGTIRGNGRIIGTTTNYGTSSMQNRSPYGY